MATIHLWKFLRRSNARTIELSRTVIIKSYILWGLFLFEFFALNGSPISNPPLDGRVRNVIEIWQSDRSFLSRNNSRLFSLALCSFYPSISKRNKPDCADPRFPSTPCSPVLLSFYSQGWFSFLPSVYPAIFFSFLFTLSPFTLTFHSLFHSQTHPVHSIHAYPYPYM